MLAREVVIVYENVAPEVVLEKGVNGVDFAASSSMYEIVGIGEVAIEGLSKVTLAA